MELEELMAMKIADEKIVGDTSPDALFQVVIRVPGGWLWRVTCGRQVTATFVPQPPERFWHISADGKVTIVEPHDMEGK